MKITLYQGDLFSVPCHGLVNPTDQKLSGAGGLDKLIQARGGEALRQACAALSNTLQPCEVAATDSGDLDCRKVLHLVSPQRAKESTPGEYTLLYTAMGNILRAVKKHKLKKIAVPLFATGNGGYDLAENYAGTGISLYAVTLLTAVADFPITYAHSRHLEEIIFVCSSPEKYTRMEQAYHWLFGKGISARSRIRGSLLAGALGDALGYPVEFVGHDRARIQELIPDPDTGKAVISDDTQMTLFTACGLLFGFSRGCMKGIGGPLHTYIHHAYVDWHRTQSAQVSDEKIPVSWIRNIPELQVRRAPGNTCLTALRQGGGSIAEPANHSKGCGGVMRIAPIPLYLAANRHGSKIQAVQECAETAAITHGHPLGWLSATALGCILYDLTLNYSLDYAVLDTVRLLRARYGNYADTVRMVQILKKAMELGRTAQTMDTDDLIRACNVTAHLGEGWVGEEALAIGLFAVVATLNGTMEDCLRCAVGHRGDSDSTGSIAGQIRGALMGEEDIHPEWLRKLELREVIGEIADDLTDDCKMSEYGSYYDPKWSRKYLAGPHSTHVPSPGEEPPFVHITIPFPAEPTPQVSISIRDVHGNITGAYTVSLKDGQLLRSATTKEAAHTGAPGYGLMYQPTYDPETKLYTETAGSAKVQGSSTVCVSFNHSCFTLLPNFEAHSVEIFSDFGPVPWLGTIRRTDEWNNPLEFRLRQDAQYVPCMVLGMIVQNLLRDALEL